MSDQSTLGALLLAAKKQQEVIEVLRPIAKVGTPMEELLKGSLASFDTIVIMLLTQHLNEVSVKLDPKKGSWEKEHATLCISYGSFLLRIPTKYIVGDIQTKMKMENTLVRIINGQLELGDGSVKAMVNIANGMSGVQKLSEAFALVSLEAYKELMLALLTMPKEKKSEYEVTPSTGYWKGESYTGLYIQLVAAGEIGTISISHCFWHDESAVNEHLRLRMVNRSLVLTEEETTAMWDKAIEKSLKHVQRATGFTWNNTPEAYSPNKKAVAGEVGPGYQMAGLYPYSF